MATSDWATQQLAEFLAVTTTAADEHVAVVHALERLVESFGAEAGAFLRGDLVVASLGWTVGDDPEDQLLGVAAGEQSSVDLPGAGPCEATVVPVDRDERTMLVLARAGEAFSADEVALLRGMARVLSLALRLLGALIAERRQAEENARLVSSLRERQALLERLSAVQHRISSRAPLPDVLNAITNGVAELLGNELAVLQLADGGPEGLSLSVTPPGAPPLGAPGARAGGARRPGAAPVSPGVGAQAIRENRLCIGAMGPEATAGPPFPGHPELRSAMAAPVRIEGKAAGSLVVGTARAGRPYPPSEQAILTAFAEHAGIAINDARAVQATKKALDDAKFQATHDELTGLPNRACFYERADQVLSLAGREGTSTAILLFDLNHFKEINDTLGHKYGDRVLCEIGPRLRQGLRQSDTLARLGGDEFCVLLPRVESRRSALEVAERILILLEQPFYVEGMALVVEASCGVAIAPDDGGDADLLLQRADVAMYVAKGSHMGVVAYDDELNTNTVGRLNLLGEMRTAVQKGQYVLHYQPKASLRDGRVEGVEALLRWQHPTLGLLPPTEFIPLAEHAGLIRPLTSWVLDAALEQLANWRRQTGIPLPDRLSMAINVSARSLLDDTFPHQVVAALERWGVPAYLLGLEITESTIMSDPPRARRLLGELAESGVKVAIDDFGTGYSSLSYLKDLPVTELKIDKSFVLDMNTNPSDAIIVRSVIDLGRNLGLFTVAEGIEDRQTWELLRDLGCDCGQGYFLAKPTPADALGNWFATREVPKLSAVR
ncbi:MAG TPA: EAL domain-containing protein [Acidimicrobiales bacterium]|nr:EAL domain-containing protein [Acidimicrobiales bacterium]